MYCFLFRAFDHIFETVSVAESTKFLLHASYCEIYNEEIRDLLGKDAKQKLDLKEHPEKGVYVNGTLCYTEKGVYVNGRLCYTEKGVYVNGKLCYKKKESMSRVGYVIQKRGLCQW